MPVCLLMPVLCSLIFEILLNTKLKIPRFTASTLLCSCLLKFNEQEL